MQCGHREDRFRIRPDLFYLRNIDYYCYLRARIFSRVSFTNAFTKNQLKIESETESMKLWLKSINRPWKTAFLKLNVFKIFFQSINTFPIFELHNIWNNNTTKKWLYSKIAHVLIFFGFFVFQIIRNNLVFEIQYWQKCSLFSANLGKYADI